jgi:hypothetical protein
LTAGGREKGHVGARQAEAAVVYGFWLLQGDPRQRKHKLPDEAAQDQSGLSGGRGLTCEPSWGIDPRP